MATSIDQKNYIKTALRLPPKLHAAVHESAQKNGRSYNAELVDLIEKALTLPEGFIAAPKSVIQGSDGSVRTGQEMMIELADLLTKATALAQIFRHYQGEPSIEIRDTDSLSPEDLQGFLGSSAAVSEVPRDDGKPKRVRKAKP